MGIADDERREVMALVRHHLLLSDTATRRDIDDGTVVSAVADAIGDARGLRMLYMLSAADGIATGSASWSPWKASLVGRLFTQTLIALESGEIPKRSDVGTRLRELEAYDPVIASSAERILEAMPHSYLASTAVEDVADDVRLLLHPPGPGEVSSRIDPGTEAGQSVVTICFLDRPGTMARAAGVLALHRISVLTAQAYSAATGVALERFVVTGAEDADLDAVRADLGAAFSGHLALEARLERKAQDYRPSDSVSVDVRILRDESEHSTVVEVRSQDALGLLYALTSAISGLDLDIHVAKIDTRGERIVDVFYVRSSQGIKLDEIQEAELRRAIVHKVGRLFG
jgi:[protein-PII] uridylyltransferase